jgi:hypothetical protein
MPPPTRGEVAGEGGAFEASASTAPLSPASNYDNYRKYISWFSQNHRSILLANTKLTAASIRGEGEHFPRPIAAALHGRAAYHHGLLHEKSIIGLAPLTVRPFALTRSSPNLSTISWTGRQASCEWGKPNFEELGTCF